MCGFKPKSVSYNSYSKSTCPDDNGIIAPILNKTLNFGFFIRFVPSHYISAALDSGSGHIKFCPSTSFFVRPKTLCVRYHSSVPHNISGLSNSSVPYLPVDGNPNWRTFTSDWNRSNCPTTLNYRFIMLVTVILTKISEQITLRNKIN